MLPDENKLKQLYCKMTNTQHGAEKEQMQNYLRTQIVPGSIDVNIMTKIDRNIFDGKGGWLKMVPMQLLH
jgi:hypothetical protein